MAELLWGRSCFVLGPASCKPTLVQEKYFTLQSASGIQADKIVHILDTSQNSTVPRQQSWSEPNKVLLSFHLLPRLTCLCTSRSTRDTNWSLNITIWLICNVGIGSMRLLGKFEVLFTGVISYILFMFHGNNFRASVTSAQWRRICMSQVF